MKKKLLFSSIGIIVVFLSIFFLCQYDNEEKVVLMDKHVPRKIETSAISMMYETEAGSGIYEESNDSLWPSEGYTFNATLSKCENGSTLTWDENSKKVMMYANTSDKCYVYFDAPPTIGSTCKNQNMGICLASNYMLDNSLYFHDSTLANGASDNSLRYAGANPDNYVCFGSEESTCPNDNLYRIIGVFNNQVKLIKYDYANSNLLGTDGDYSSSTYSNTSSSFYKGSLTTINRYYWNVNGTNTWSESQLNTVNLNTNYINNIGSDWASKIATTTWKVGGNTHPNIVQSATPATAYQNEIVSPAESTTYSAKIGLMYVSEYGYAASPENWTTTLFNYDNDTNINNNWMFMGLYELTISRDSGNANVVFVVGGTGYVLSGSVADYYGARPSFNLESSVILTGGAGTMTDPYRIT